MAILSILSLYNYNEAIFDDLQIPTADDIMDDADKVPDPWIPNKQDLIDYICMECAEFELLYPDWNIMQRMIRTWSRARIGIWIQLYNTMLYKYNPIWNKDGSIEETRSGTDLDRETRNLQTGETETRNLTIADEGGTTANTSATTTNSVTGYDNNDYAPNTRDTTTGETTTESDNTRTDSGTINRTTTGGGNIQNDRTRSETFTRRETGNIGVTMTQEMIQKQRDIVMFDLYDEIASEFKEKFCLLLY